MNAYERFDVACTAVDQAKELHDLIVGLADALPDWDHELTTAVGGLRTQASMAWSDAVKVMTVLGRDLP